MIGSVIPTDNKTPGAYIRVSLGVGQRSSGDAPRIVALFGNKTSAGTATAGEEYEPSGEDEARTLFGAGSELFLMVKFALKANPGATIRAVVIAESAGTAATGTITAVGTATGPGTAYVYVMGERIEVPIATGDVIATVATAIAAAIVDKTDWPVTAVSALGVATLTAKQKGPRGNEIGVRATIDAPGLTLTGPATGYLTAGATSDDPQTVLDATAARRYHYLACPYNDATNLGKFKSRVDATEEPEIGNLETVVAFSHLAPAATTAIAIALNFPRVQLAWAEGNEQTSAVCAAMLAAVRARYEGINPAVNLDAVEIPGMRQSPRIADVPLASEIKGALNNGVTPITPRTGGTMAIARSITTKSLDSSAQPDYRVLDTSKVTICDAFADVLEASFVDTYQRPGEAFNLAADSLTGDPLPPGVATPSLIKSWAGSLHRRYDATAQGSVGSWFENVDTWVPLIVAEIAASPSGRVNLSIPVDPVEGLHQGSIDLRQVG